MTHSCYGTFASSSRWNDRSRSATLLSLDDDLHKLVCWKNTPALRNKGVGGKEEKKTWERRGVKTEEGGRWEQTGRRSRKDEDIMSDGARRQENKKQEVEWKNEGSGRRETVLWSDLCVTLASIKSKDSFGRRSGVSLSFLWVVEIDGLSPGYRRHNSASSPKGKSESHSRNPAQRLEWFLSYSPWPHFWWFPFMFCTFITPLNVFKCKRVLQQTLTTSSFSSERPLLSLCSCPQQPLWQEVNAEQRQETGSSGGMKESLTSCGGEGNERKPPHDIIWSSTELHSRPAAGWVSV